MPDKEDVDSILTHRPTFAWLEMPVGRRHVQPEVFLGVLVAHRLGAVGTGMAWQWLMSAHHMANRTAKQTSRNRSVVSAHVRQPKIRFTSFAFVFLLMSMACDPLMDCQLAGRRFRWVLLQGYGCSSSSHLCISRIHATKRKLCH